MADRHYGRLAPSSGTSWVLALCEKRRRWIETASARVVTQRGLHLVPFVLSPTWPLLRALDGAGAILGALYVKQCVRAVRER